MKSSYNSPNPAKFIKEMQALIPQLKAKGVIPMTREEARAQGLKSTTEAAIKTEKEHQRRLDILSRRLDEYMKELSPFGFRVALLTGWSGIFRALGYTFRIEATKESVEGCPGIACTRVYVERRLWGIPFMPRRTVKGERLVWEEPKPQAKPKGKIIHPGRDFDGKPHGGIILP